MRISAKSRLKSEQISFQNLFFDVSSAIIKLPNTFSTSRAPKLTFEGSKLHESMAQRIGEIIPLTPNAKIWEFAGSIYRCAITPKTGNRMANVWKHTTCFIESSLRSEPRSVLIYQQPFSLLSRSLERWQKSKLLNCENAMTLRNFNHLWCYSVKWSVVLMQTLRGTFWGQMVGRIQAEHEVFHN